VHGNLTAVFCFRICL